jgi:hypothetical protein
VRKGHFHPKRGRNEEIKKKPPISPHNSKCATQNRIHETIRRAFRPDGAEQGEEKGEKIDNTYWLRFNCSSSVTYCYAHLPTLTKILSKTQNWKFGRALSTNSKNHNCRAYGNNETRRLNRSRPNSNTLIRRAPLRTCISTIMQYYNCCR